MEKYGVDNKNLVNDLRNEEGMLMAQMSAYMSRSEKTASEQAEMDTLESRLLQVRDKITSLDKGGDAL